MWDGSTCRLEALPRVQTPPDHCCFSVSNPLQLLPSCGCGIRIARLAHWQRCTASTVAAASDTATHSIVHPADEAYRVEIDGVPSASKEPPSEPWFAGSVHCAMSDAAATLQLWFDGAVGGADAVIIRPDRFVYGSYTAAELPEALDKLARTLLTGVIGRNSLLLPRNFSEALLESELGAVSHRSTVLQRFLAVAAANYAIITALLILITVFAYSYRI